MANSRIARFITEVAPPQMVNVMRHRTSKVLDTINEEEIKDVSPNHDSLNSSMKMSRSSTQSSSMSALSSSSATNCGSSLSYNFLKEIPKSFSIFEN